jgi:hypothetical protein
MYSLALVILQLFVPLFVNWRCFPTLTAWPREPHPSRDGSRARNTSTTVTFVDLISLKRGLAGERYKLWSCSEQFSLVSVSSSDLNLIFSSAPYFQTRFICVFPLVYSFLRQHQSICFILYHLCKRFQSMCVALYPVLRILNLRCYPFVMDFQNRQNDTFMFSVFRILENRRQNKRFRTGR